MSKHETPQTPFPDGPLPVTPEEFLNLADASACVVGAFSDLALKDPAALGMVLAAGLDENGEGKPWAPSLRRCVLALQRLAGLPANAGSVYELALDLANAGDWPEAERAARAALRVMPEHGGQSWPTPAAVGGLLAQALLKQGRREVARAVALEARDQAADKLDGEAAYEVLAELLDAGELAKLYPDAKREALEDAGEPLVKLSLVPESAQGEHRHCATVRYAWLKVIETFEANPLEAYEIFFQSSSMDLADTPIDERAVWYLLRTLTLAKHPEAALDCLYRMGCDSQSRGWMDSAESLYRRAAGECRRLGTSRQLRSPLWWILRNLVEVLLAQGKVEGLYALLVEAVDDLRKEERTTVRELRDLAGQVLPHCNPDQARALREIFGELPGASKGGA